MRSALIAVFALMTVVRIAAAGEATLQGNQVIAKTVRFTVLSPTLIRMEHSPRGAFVDAPSLVAADRDWAKVDFQLHQTRSSLEIITEKLRLHYIPRSGRFTSLNLRIEMKRGDKPVIWHLDMVNKGNLGGTRRDLDGVAGPVPLSDGILSRDGWYLLDDSRSPIIEDGWPRPRDTIMAQDFYFFGYGDDYEQGLKDFNDLSGKIPLPPEWALGVWLLCDWPLTGDELLDIVRDFREKNIPLDVLVVSNWSRYGWTSYDWAPGRFPDPEQFLREAHKLGVKVGVNVHPGGALLPAESRYEAVAQAVGWDTKRRAMIFFDVSSQKQGHALTDVLLPPVEKQGVDFWWVDGAAAVTMRRLGRQWWTNHLFFHGSRLSENKRGLILAPYGGPGSHRFVVGYGGIPRSSWEALNFLTYFTSTAGNVGLTFMGNVVCGQADEESDDEEFDREMFIRWLQFGVVGPIVILRTFRGKTPWMEDPEMVAATGRILRTRKAFTPYIYTLAARAHQRGLPICRPMYIHNPNTDEAYEFGHQYMLGGDFLVAPMAQPASVDTLKATKRIWFPPGEWHDFLTNRIIEGPTVLNYGAWFGNLPIFARIGSITPLTWGLQPDVPRHERLTLEISAGASGQFELYMDDGITRSYLKGDGGRAMCVISYFESEETRILRIGEIVGDYEGKPSRRSYEVRLNTFLPVTGVVVNGVVMPELPAEEVETDSDMGACCAVRPGWYYDVERIRLVVNTSAFATSEPVEVVFVGEFAAENRRLAYRVREIVSRLESAAILLTQSKAPPEFVERIREIERMAEKAALRSYRAPLVREDLEAGLATVRKGIVELVKAANEVIKSDVVKLQFMKSIVGISISGRIIPSPYRQVVLRNEIRFQPFGWGEITGTIRVENHRPRPITLLRPKDNVFFETPVGIDTIRLKELTFRVRADLTWNGVPIQLALEETFDNTFIKQYYLIGPFGDGSYRRIAEVSFPPERRIRLDASYVGKKRKSVDWKKLPWQAPVKNQWLRGRSERDFRFVDLGLSLERMPPAAGYAVAHVFVPQNTPAKLLIGSQGGIALWVNDIEVFRQVYMRRDRPDEADIETQLDQGWNVIRVKVLDEGNLWGFYLRLVGADGMPIPGARSGWGPGLSEM